jgi:hypothetical protein
MTELFLMNVFDLLVEDSIIVEIKAVEQAKRFGKHKSSVI